MWAKLDECTCNTGRAAREKSKIPLFETIDQYMEEYLGFSNLVFDNFESIFHYYALFCTLVFVAFCVHYLAKFTWKRTILLRYSLRDRFAGFASGFRQVFRYRAIR